VTWIQAGVAGGQRIESINGLVYSRLLLSGYEDMGLRSDQGSLVMSQKAFTSTYHGALGSFCGVQYWESERVPMLENCGSKTQARETTLVFASPVDLSVLLPDG
jgi:hypothetical protein